MHEFRHGQPLRSEDLNSRIRASEEAASGALEETADMAHRLDQIELALLTVESRVPEDRPQTAAAPGVLYLPVRPLLGTELFGANIVTARNKAKRALSGEITGRGELSLLRSGEIFAALSAEQIDRFEARINPARLTEYNELVLPYVAGGPLMWRLYHSRGYHEYAGIRETTVFRYDTPREFNGYVELVSESRTGLEGQFIHAGAGLSVNMSDWLASGTLEASRELPFSGTIRIENVDTYPGKAPAGSYQIFVNDTDVTAQQNIVVAAGDLLRLEVDIDWTRSVRHVAASYFHAATS